MPLVDFLFRCPFCHHDPMVGEGDTASCPSCATTFERGGEGGLIRVGPPSKGSREVPGHELGAPTLPEDGLPEGPHGEVRSARVRVKTAHAEKAIRHKGRTVGFSEVFGPETEGILKLSTEALSLWPMEEGSPPLQQWSLLDIGAVQTTSSSLQITPKTGYVVQFLFPEDSTRRWEALLHRCLRDRFRREGLGEILEFQPRIVAAAPESRREWGLEAGAGPLFPAPKGILGSGPLQATGEGLASEGDASRTGFPWYAFLRPLARLLVALGSRLEVRGLENIPRTGPFVLVANHQSVLDPIFVQVACPRELHTLTKSTQFGIGIFGWLLPRLKAIPTRRYRVDPQAVRVVLKRLSQGEAVGIYPEGERSWDGTLQPFRRGTLRLLMGAGVPVVPCGVAGAYDAWPRWSRRLKRKRVRVSFGEPMIWPHLNTRPERERAVPWAMETLTEALARLGAWTR